MHPMVSIKKKHSSVQGTIFSPGPVIKVAGAEKGRGKNTPAYNSILHWKAFALEIVKHGVLRKSLFPQVGMGIIISEYLSSGKKMVCVCVWGVTK